MRPALRRFLPVCRQPFIDQRDGAIDDRVVHAELLADQLHEERAKRSERERVIIGYGSGTATHDIDFLEAAPALIALLRKYPILEFWVVGPLALPSEFANFGERVRRFELTDWQGWFRRMAEMDIVLAPLEKDNIFCRAKSEIKFVEAGALGLPVVASDIDSFRASMTHGRDGFLAANEKEWRKSLEALISDKELRSRMGEAARKTVLQNYSPVKRSEDLRRLLAEF